MDIKPIKPEADDEEALSITADLMEIIQKYHRKMYIKWDYWMGLL